MFHWPHNPGILAYHLDTCIVSRISARCGVEAGLQRCRLDYHGRERNLTGMVPPWIGVSLQTVETSGAARIDAEAFAIVLIIRRNACQVGAHWEPRHHDPSV